MQNSFEELTQLSEDFLVRITPLPESGRAWLEIGEPFGGSFTVASARLCQDLLSAKTFPAFYPPMEGDPSEQSSVAWSNSGMACAGGFLTFATSESPSGGGESSLSQLLETDVAPKYYLTPSQLAYAMRRRESRGWSLEHWRIDIRQEVPCPDGLSEITEDTDSQPRENKSG